MSRSRLIVYALIVAVAVAIGILASAQHRRELLPVPASVATELTAREVAAAQRLGMTMRDQGDLRLAPQFVGAGPTWSYPVQLEARECVAFIAAAHGQALLAAMTLTADDGRRLANAPDAARLVGQLQWCTLQPAHVVFNLGIVPREQVQSGDPSMRVHYVVLRATWDRVGGMAALTRGSLDPTAVDAVLAGDDQPPFEAELATSPDGGVPLGDPYAIRIGEARLIPAGERAYRALYTLNASDAGAAVNPRVDPEDLVTHRRLHGVTRFDPAVVAEDLANGRAVPSEHDPVVDVGGNNFRRVLAVLDPDALGSRCVVLRWIRGLRFSPAPVARFDASTWQETLLATNSNVATDVLCPPPEQPIAYVTHETDQAEYRLQLYSVERPPTSE